MVIIASLPHHSRLHRGNTLYFPYQQLGGRPANFSNPPFISGDAPGCTANCSPGDHIFFGSRSVVKAMLVDTYNLVTNCTQMLARPWPERELASVNSGVWGAFLQHQGFSASVMLIGYALLRSQHGGSVPDCMRLQYHPPYHDACRALGGREGLFKKNTAYMLSKHLGSCVGPGPDVVDDKTEVDFDTHLVPPEPTRLVHAHKPAAVQIAKKSTLLQSAETESLPRCLPPPRQRPAQLMKAFSRCAPGQHLVIYPLLKPERIRLMRDPTNIAASMCAHEVEAVRFEHWASMPCGISASGERVQACLETKNNRTWGAWTRSTLPKMLPATTQLTSQARDFDPCDGRYYKDGSPTLVTLFRHVVAASSVSPATWVLTLEDDAVLNDPTHALTKDEIREALTAAYTFADANGFNMVLFGFGGASLQCRQVDRSRFKSSIIDLWANCTGTAGNAVAMAMKKSRMQLITDALDGMVAGNMSCPADMMGKKRGGPGGCMRDPTMLTYLLQQCRGSSQEQCASLYVSLRSKFQLAQLHFSGLWRRNVSDSISKVAKVAGLASVGSGVFPAGREGFVVADEATHSLSYGHR